MITTTILAILGVALAAVLFAMFRTGAVSSGGPRAVAAPAAAAISPPGRDRDPWEARKGDVISLTGAAEDYSDLDFPVDRRSAYEANNRRWVDLSGDYRGQRVYLEVYRYPQPDLIGILDPRRLTLTDLSLTEEELAAMDERQNPNDSIAYDGKRWHFESSRELHYFEGEAGEGEGLYRWIFREPDGQRLLCIEKWEGEPFEVRLARRLNSRDVTVYNAA